MLTRALAGPLEKTPSSNKATCGSLVASDPGQHVYETKVGSLFLAVFPFLAKEEVQPCVVMSSR